MFKELCKGVRTRRKVQWTNKHFPGLVNCNNVLKEQSEAHA